MRTWVNRLLQNEQAGLLLALILLCVVLSFLSPVFFTALNIKNVLRDAALVAIAGIGMVMVILLGEIDLSVGSVQAVAGIVAVAVLNSFSSVFVALGAALFAGACIGLINGLLITRAHINSLIATLGMMAILRGGAMVSTQAVSHTRTHRLPIAGALLLRATLHDLWPLRLCGWRKSAGS